MFYLDVPFMCIYALVSIINNTIQYKYVSRSTMQPALTVDMGLLSESPKCRIQQGTFLFVEHV